MTSLLDSELGVKGLDVSEANLCFWRRADVFAQLLTEFINTGKSADKTMFQTLFLTKTSPTCQLTFPGKFST